MSAAPCLWCDLLLLIDVIDVYRELVRQRDGGHRKRGGAGEQGSRTGDWVQSASEVLIRHCPRFVEEAPRFATHGWGMGGMSGSRLSAPRWCDQQTTNRGRQRVSLPLCPLPTPPPPFYGHRVEAELQNEQVLRASVYALKAEQEELRSMNARTRDENAELMRKEQQYVHSLTVLMEEKAQMETQKQQLQMQKVQLTQVRFALHWCWLLPSPPSVIDEFCPKSGFCCFRSCVDCGSDRGLSFPEREGGDLRQAPDPRTRCGPLVWPARPGIAGRQSPSQLRNVPGKLQDVHENHNPHLSGRVVPCPSQHGHSSPAPSVLSSW